MVGITSAAVVQNGFEVTRCGVTPSKAAAASVYTGAADYTDYPN